MSRIGLVEDSSSPQVAALIEKLKAGRRGSLLKLYGALLHSPRLAETWFAHLNAVRWETGMSGRLREILIIRVAHLNRTEYVLKQHVPKLAEQEGLHADECLALLSTSGKTRFSGAEAAAIAYADEMTTKVQVAETVFAQLPKFYSEAQIVELTVLIATYNMHTRVVSALDLDLED